MQPTDSSIDQLGIVIETNDPERVWNAFRLGCTAREEGHDVAIFLLGAGVESETIDDDTFDVRDRMNAFVDAGGELAACGTCLDLRNEDGSKQCSLSTMHDLLEIVTESDRVLTIG